MTVNSLLCRQLGWETGHEILAADAADPAQFAAHVISLYRNAKLWQQIRDSAFERLRAENGEQVYEAAIRDVIEGRPASNVIIYQQTSHGDAFDGER